MNRSDYGQKAEIIGQMTDVNQLMALLKNPQYAGFTNVVIARLTELNKMKQAPQGQQPPAPTVAQQAMAGQAPPDQPAMARGGIIAFKHGGEVRKFKKGGDLSVTERIARKLGLSPEDADADQQQAAPDTTPDAYKEGWNTVGQYIGDAGRKLGSAAGDVLLAMPAAATQRVANVGIGGINALGGNIPYMQETSPYAFSDDTAGGPPPTAPQALGRQPDIGAIRDLRGDFDVPQTPATAYKPVTAKDLGLPSLDAASLMAAQKSGGTGSFDPDSFKKYYDAIKGLAGDNPDAETQRAEIAKNKKNAVNFALMHAGLGMAQSASEHPHYGFAGNLASGAGAGLGAYEKSETEQNAAQRELARLDRQEKLGIAGLAVGERGQDVRAARQDALQRAAIGAQLKGPALQEANIRNFAVALANEDRAKGVQKPLPYYHQKAWEAYNAGITTAGMRGDSSQQQRLEQEYTKQINSGQLGDHPPPFSVWATQYGPIAPASGGTLVRP